jgi:Putative lumazine-binding
MFCDTGGANDENAKEARKGESRWSNSMTEKEAIARTGQHYIDGAKSGSSAEMRRAFHADATIYGYEGDGLFAGPIQRLFDGRDRKRTTADLKANIVNIDVGGTIATVRLERDNWTGTNYRFPSCRAVRASYPRPAPAS